MQFIVMQSMNMQISDAEKPQSVKKKIRMSSANHRQETAFSCR
jgi:hypothetical protein